MKKLLCKIRGHSFVPFRKPNSQIQEYQCSCCKQHFTKDGYGQIVKLTKYWKENNELFEKHFQKKVIS